MKSPDVCPCIDRHLEDLYAMAVTIGLLAAQVDEPDLDAITDQAMKHGAKMAATARKRRVKP